MSARDLSQAERAAGLAAPLPPGERILWQASPADGPFTRAVFRARGLAIYALIAIAATIAVVARDRPLGQAVGAATLLLPVFALAWGLLLLVGAASARSTTYTLTNRRVMLHIGVAYEVTVSIPLSAITGAALRRRADGSGEIALTVRPVSEGGVGVGYVALWPHARFGRFLHPEPMLRGLAEPDQVREAIADALVAFNAGGRVSRAHPADEIVLPMIQAAAA